MVGSAESTPVAVGPPAHERIDRLATALSRPRVRDIVVFIVFFLLTALWFHRLMLHMGSAVLSGPNDESYGIRQYWGAEYLGKNPFTEHRDTLNGAPEGLSVSSAVQIANFIIPAAIWGLHWLVGFTAAANVFLLGGFVLTGFSMYLLLVRLGLHPLAGIYGGYALAFNPWMIERAYAGHGGFMQAWVFPLLVASLLWLHRRRSVVSAVVVGLMFAVSFYESSYYGLLATLVISVFLLVDFAQQANWRERLWSFSLADVMIITALVAFIPALIAWRGDRHAVAASISNPLQDLQNLGASPQSYILPAVRHPVLGGITTHFYPDAANKWSENTLFQGWTLIILGIVGAILVARRHPASRQTPTQRFFLVCMTFLAPAAFVFSLKRETNFFGITLPMPSYLVGELTTFWRVFARFGLLVTFALASLAALALSRWLRHHRYGAAIWVCAMALLVFEYYAGVAPIYSFSETPYSAWIAKQPPGIVANYPMPTDSPVPLHLLALTYYQQIFNHHPQYMLFGSGYGGTREDAIRILTRYITDPVTPSILKAEHVKYILLHDDAYREQSQPPPAVPAGFHLVARIAGNVRALELDKDVVPADLPTVLSQNAASIAAVEGLQAPSVSLVGKTTPIRVAGEDWRLLHDRVVVRLSNVNPAIGAVQLIIRASSPGVARTLELSDAHGVVLAKATVNTRTTQVLFGPVALDAKSPSFVLSVEPAGPLRLAQVYPQPLANLTHSILDD